ncbi:MAG: hypothetical protein WKF82_08195 [Nocardioidaceae bacterium]
MGPVVTEVEHVDELLAGGQRAQADLIVQPRVRWRVVPVAVDQQAALLAELEHAGARGPPGEGVVDGDGQLSEGGCGRPRTCGQAVAASSTRRHQPGRLGSTAMSSP